MKNILGIVSWIIAIIGAIAIALATYVIENNILFWVGIPMIVIGIIGILLFGGRTKEFIWNLLDLL